MAAWDIRLRCAMLRGDPLAVMHRARRLAGYGRSPGAAPQASLARSSARRASRASRRTITWVNEPSPILPHAL